MVHMSTNTNAISCFPIFAHSIAVSEVKLEESTFQWMLLYFSK